MTRATAAILAQSDHPAPLAQLAMQVRAGEEELVAVGPEELHARLAGLDPAAAASVLPSNGRRIVRALEVIELTGGPFTAKDYRTWAATMTNGSERHASF